MMKNNKFCPLIKDWCFDSCIFYRTIIVFPTTPITEELKNICLIAETLEKISFQIQVSKKVIV